MRCIFDAADLNQQRFLFANPEDETAVLGLINSYLRDRASKEVQEWVSIRINDVFTLRGESEAEIPNLNFLAQKLTEKERGYETIVRSVKRRILMEMIENRDKISGLSSHDFFVKSNLLGQALAANQYYGLRVYSPNDLELKIRLRTALMRARFSTLAELALASAEEVTLTTGLNENHISQIKVSLLDFIEPEK